MTHEKLTRERFSATQEWLPSAAGNQYSIQLLTVTHKDIVITGIRLKITHESAEQMSLSWRGIVQRMGTMNYPQVGAVPFEKELNVLAMKVSLKDVEERFIRFQNVDFLQHKAELEAITLKTMAHLHQTQSL